MLMCSRTLSRITIIVRQPVSARALSRVSVERGILNGHGCLHPFKRESIVSRRWYSQEKAPAEDTSETQQAEGSKMRFEDIPATRFLEVLENTAGAPWLSQIPSDPKDRLKRAYTLLFQIILYLGRPQEPEVAEQFLLAFESAPVSDTSEISRARKAVARILQVVVQDISSISMSSPLRTEHTELFAIFGALLPLHDVYLSGSREGEVANWGEFWGRAQPVMLQLAMKLDDNGYGMKLEEEQEN